jgi:hypothetical protein
LRRRVDLTINNITDVGDVIIPALDSNGTRDPLIGDEQDAGSGITPDDDATCTSSRRIASLLKAALATGGPAGTSGACLK